MVTARRGLRTAAESVVILLGFASDVGIAVVIEDDVDHDRIAADGAVFDVGLRLPGRGVDGDDDLFAAVVTNVAAFILDHRAVGAGAGGRHGSIA